MDNNSALEDDALQALKNFQERELHGRKMKLEYGFISKDKKKRKSDEVSPEEPSETQKKPKLAEVSKDSNEKEPLSDVVSPKNASAKAKKVEKVTKAAAKTDGGDDKEEKEEGDDDDDSVDGTDGTVVKHSRQLLVFGIPIDVNKKDFKLVLFKYSRKSTVELIKEDHELSASLHIVDPPGKIMLITAPSRKESIKLMELFTKNTLNNLGFSKFVDENNNNTATTLSDNSPEELLKLKYRLRERLVIRTVADITSMEYRKRKCRLIIHNLSFQAIEKNIVDKLKKFGPLVEVELPRVTIQKTTNRRNKRSNANDNNNEEDNNNNNNSNNNREVERPKGFAFVTFLCEKDATKAVEDSAGLKICNREVAIDYSMSKSTYERFGKQGQDEEDKEEGEGDDEVKMKVKEEEVVKEKKVMVKKHEEDEDEESTSSSSSDNNSEDEEESDNEDEDEDNEEEEEEEADNASDEDDDNEAEDEEDEAKEEKIVPKERVEDVNEGKTIFLRGLPFDVTSEHLKTIFLPYGKIALAIIVADKITGVSKGSAFVKFYSSMSVTRCLTAYPNKTISIQDHECFIDLAVNKNQVQDLTVLHQQQKAVGKDKRNLYLSNEGLLLNQEKIVLTNYDREKLQKAQIDKKKKLQNPIFFVSNIRLSIRNLSKLIASDYDFKQICIQATQNGLKKGLVTSEDMKKVFIAQGYQSNAIQNQMLQYQPMFNTNTNGSNTNPLDACYEIPSFHPKHGIKSCKIMLDYQKLRDGLPQSKGYGFIEFTHHAYALACLRELTSNYKQYETLAITRKTIAKDSPPATNNNHKPTLTDEQGRLIVEFSLEDFRKVKEQFSYFFFLYV